MTDRRYYSGNSEFAREQAERRAKKLVADNIAKLHDDNQRMRGEIASLRARVAELEAENQRLRQCRDQAIAVYASACGSYNPTRCTVNAKKLQTLRDMAQSLTTTPTLGGDAAKEAPSA